MKDVSFSKLVLMLTLTAATTKMLRTQANMNRKDKRHNLELKQ
jgi:hypothetical protein